MHQELLYSMPFQDVPYMRSDFSSLPDYLKAVFIVLFNKQKNPLNIKNILKLKQKPTSTPFCSKLFNNKVQSYRCFDCQVHPLSMLCQECFKKGKHQLHRFQQIKQEGNCDCGNRDTLKEAGFCDVHNGVEQVVQVNRVEQFIFQLGMKQMFIWIFKIIKIGQQNAGQQLFLAIIKLLQKLNTLSLHYNIMTTDLLFGQAYIHHIIILTLNSQQKHKLSQACISLFHKMFTLAYFKQKLLVEFIYCYNHIQNFQSSKYIQLYYPLISQSKIVVKLFKRYKITLSPSVQYDHITYYEHLFAIKDIQIQAARAFIEPIISAGYIRLPLLDKIQDKCQIGSNPIITVFPEHIKEEYLYYKLLMKIIEVIDNKSILQIMLSHYYHMIKRYSFITNKIILVPQRIFVLLIYKYFDCNLTKIIFGQLAKIIDIAEDDFGQFISEIFHKFLECLMELAKNINRTTYFQNYLPLYVKQKGQIVMVDYLGVKITALLLKYSHPESYTVKMKSIFKMEGIISDQSNQDKIERFRVKNVMVKILTEIFYSPRTEIINSQFIGMGNTQSQIKCLLKRLFRNIGQVSVQELKSIGELFCFKQIPKKIIEELLNFDKTKKRFIPIQNLSDDQQLMTHMLTSLLLTKLSKFVTKRQQKTCNLFLNRYQQIMKKTIFDYGILQLIVNRQMQLIGNIKQNFLMIKELIELIQFVKIAYRQEYFQQLFVNVTKFAKNLVTVQEFNELQNLIIADSLTDKSVIIDKDKEKRKDLMRLKKQQLIKNKKMKENQQLFMQEGQIYKNNNISDKQICLVCKESGKNSQICFVGCVKFTSLMFDCVNLREDNVVFKTCFHAIHYDCFQDIQKNRGIFYCPLCKGAMNIILPYQDNLTQFILEKATSNIQKIMDNHKTNSFIQNRHKTSFVFESTLFFVYYLLANIQQPNFSTQRHIRLGRLIYILIRYNYLNPEKRQEAFKQKCEFLQKLNKTKDNELQSKFVFLCEFIFHLIFFDLEQAQFVVSGQIIRLQQIIERSQIKQLITIIDRIMSQQGQSKLKSLLGQISGIDKLSSNPIFRFYTPPSTIPQLLHFRDISKFICQLGHSICVCIICMQKCCLTCKNAEKHLKRLHQKQCLFFNIYTGGFYYSYDGYEISIRSQYISKTGKIWKIQRQDINQYYFDQKQYQQIIKNFKNNNLFSYFINNYEGLKGNNVNDRI